MKKAVLISGASFAGLTLAYWLAKFGYKVTLVEIGKGLRKGGSPIDVRGEALAIASEMGVLEKIKAKEFIHTDEIVNANDETLVTFALNARTEYLGDIEINREDLLDILYEIVSGNEVEFLFASSIKTLIQREANVEVTFENEQKRNFDFVFGADGTHSVVRKLIFGAEEKYSQFFGAYFAFAEANAIETGRLKKNTGIIYRELGKQAAIYQFKNGANVLVVFRSPKLTWDYRNREQQKQILNDAFSTNSNWKIPEILNIMLHSDNLYFDEVCQIHMPSWTKGRVALVGDAAYAPSFFTGMGTSLAMQGSTLLAKALSATDDYQTAFANYNEMFKPVVDSIQSRISRGLKVHLPETEEELQASIDRFKIQY